MRNRDEHVFDRRRRPKEFRKNYFLAFEGFTELQYFEGIKGHRTELDIDGNIDLQLLSRFEQDRGDSDPRNILKEMSEYRDMIRTGSYSVRLFIGEVLQQACTIKCTGRGGHEIMKRISSLRNELKDALESSEYSHEGLMDDHSWEEAASLCEKIIREGLSDDIRLHTPPSRLMETYDEDTDVFCLIVDRDRDSRPARYYRDLVDKCFTEKVSLYVTNPCFEFWLFMHFDMSLDMSTETQELLSDDRITEGQTVRTSMRLLLEAVSGFSKSDIGFERSFLNRIGSAIENSKSFETDLGRLENNIGSNLGDLMEKVRSNT